MKRHLHQKRRPRHNSRVKRRDKKDERMKWFRDLRIKELHRFACEIDFDGDIVREDGSINWAAAFAAP